MPTFYAKIRIEGMSNPIPVKAEAINSSDAKKIIEAQNGKVKSWANLPSQYSKPPSWFK